MITVGLHVKGKVVVVVGGGAVAERKVRALLASEALVRVVSPELSAGLRHLSEQGRIQVRQRPYVPADLAGALLVVAATGNPEVDAAVARQAETEERLVAVTADPRLGNTTFTAEFQRGPVRVAVSTEGASPALAGRLRRELERLVGPEYGHLAELLGGIRERVQRCTRRSDAERAAFFSSLVEGPALDMLARGEADRACALVENAVASFLAGASITPPAPTATGGSVPEAEGGSAEGAAPSSAAGAQQRGLILVNTGDGKGKSTAAFGMALRAVGQGMRVLVVQFIKGTWRTGEQRAARWLPGLEWYRGGYGFVRFRPSRRTEDEHAARARQTWDFARGRVAGDVYDLLVLDEINVAMRLGFINPPEVAEWLVSGKPRRLHVVLTGRGAPAEIVGLADTVTEMTPVKHAYQRGVGATKGIEY